MWEKDLPPTGAAHGKGNKKKNYISVAKNAENMKRLRLMTKFWGSKRKTPYTAFVDLHFYTTARNE